MNARILQLRNLVVALDRIDRKLADVDAEAYRAAAQTAFSLTYEEMGLLPMSDFAGPVNALQNMAENIHFAVNGCFADVDGTGRAIQARMLSKGLFERLRANGTERAQEIVDGLMVRIGPASASF